MRNRIVPQAAGGGKGREADWPSLRRRQERSPTKRAQCSPRPGTKSSSEVTVVSGQATSFVHGTARSSTADVSKWTQIDVSSSDARPGPHTRDGANAALICVHLCTPAVPKFLPLSAQTTACRSRLGGVGAGQPASFLLEPS